ncbi:MAG: hypothetical protein WC554_04765 [Clostridia bacterium]
MEKKYKISIDSAHEKKDETVFTIFYVGKSGKFEFKKIQKSSEIIEFINKNKGFSSGENVLTEKKLSDFIKLSFDKRY